MAESEKHRQEHLLLSEMIALFCKGNHKSIGLCPECRVLLGYAQERSEKCPRMETKTFCSACEIHCYRSDMRKQIRNVMRYSGPRMLFYHPIVLIRHVLTGKKEKTRYEI